MGKEGKRTRERRQGYLSYGMAKMTKGCLWIEWRQKWLMGKYLYIYIYIYKGKMGNPM